ncbi:exopolysaccharide biosynthesis polyprenyl glycosylphosphotransferase [Pseudoroseomonas cervicalis]|uniref:exopolysaccharide biosynthesis polyprenyl glycosylphosphotransferase n=1 Tax=Teichococcus cervicalis TaxID=204525 RepID=UPI002783998D|nr:exopolysaccharide biosynthesis polyprenyl glycosylphosphotransferase [Pseudoroseomonas cervicalis]MDQ1080825.1 exopolysaccharide biosynthesis polyprenyl glycosylphosphotransferase [Pseudoroseomonas cervicalis]
MTQPEPAPSAAAARGGLAALGQSLATVRWTHGLINRVVKWFDVAMLLLPAAFFGLLPGSDASPLAWQQALVIAAAQVWAYLSVMERISAYRVEHYQGFWGQLGHILAGLAVGWAVGLIALQACLPGQLPLNQPWFLEWHALQFLLLLLSRQWHRLMVYWVERRRLLCRKVVVVGANPTGARVLAELTAPDKAAEYELVGVFADSSDGDVGHDGAAPAALDGHAVLGGLPALSAFAQDNTIDLIVLALPWSRAQELFRLMHQVEWIAADVVIPFDPEGVPPNYARIAPLGRLRALQVMVRPFKGTQGVVKVIEDYVIASVALLLLSPIMIAAAIAIRLDSPGPIFFKQWRPGLGQKPFAIYKFRTMLMDPTDDGSVGTQSRNDPRITRVGGLLRRLSIDELPQLINVLRGEMSIVGPRPYVANMLVGQERFSEMVRQYAARHRIKPGLTGWAQANGMRSYALRSPENARKSIEMDLYYITHWSLWLDIRIMVRTVVVGLAGRNVF